jgi:hypothetical protein
VREQISQISLMDPGSSGRIISPGIGRALLGLAALAAAAPVAAMPPPLRLPVVVVSEDAEAQALAEAFMTYLREHGYLARESPSLERTALWPCLRGKADQEACIRKQPGWKASGAAVVVIVSGPDARTWRCIGVGAKPASPTGQLVQVDVKDGLFGSAEARRKARNTAAQCVTAAGSESGW